jgi:hypothetical protein
LFGWEETVERIDFSASARRIYDFVGASFSPEFDGRVGGEIFEAELVPTVGRDNTVVAGGCRLLFVWLDANELTNS